MCQKKNTCIGICGGNMKGMVNKGNKEVHNINVQMTGYNPAMLPYSLLRCNFH